MNRIKISAETRQLLQEFAQSQGHNNISAALATVVKLGLPLLSSIPTKDQTQPTPSPDFLVKTEVRQQEVSVDATIERLALLLEEF